MGRVELPPNNPANGLPRLQPLLDCLGAASSCDDGAKPLDGPELLVAAAQPEAADAVRVWVRAALGTAGVTAPPPSVRPAS